MQHLKWRGFDLDGYACACMFTHFDHDASRDGLL